MPKPKQKPQRQKFGLFALAAICGLSLSPIAHADPAKDLPQPALETPEIAGDATLRWLGFRVFDAVLWTPKGVPYNPTQQAALKLNYAQKFSKTNLMRSTMEELKRLEGERDDHPTLRKKLTGCFKDVGKGDAFLAMGLSKDRVDLYRNQERTCTLAHPGIRARFLDIWLSPNSRFPELSRALRGAE